MRSRHDYAKDRLAAAVVLLLSLASFPSCATGHRVGSAGIDGVSVGNENADSTAFVPLHPPVVVPHTWREEMDVKQPAVQ